MTFATCIGVYFLISVLVGAYLHATGEPEGVVVGLTWPAILLFFLLCLPFAAVSVMAEKLGELLKKRMAK